MLAGYCWPRSARPGERIELFLHSDHGAVDVLVHRIGARAILMERHVGVPATAQSVPGGSDNDRDVAANGCAWRASHALVIGDEWPSGFYRIDLSTGSYTAETFFVVKAHDNKSVDAVLVLSTSTWDAYNDWGGPSYYTGGVRVSMRRPLPRGFLHKDTPERFRTARFKEWNANDAAAFRAARYSGWCMAAGWANWEMLFVRWAEHHALRLGYGTSEDLISDPALLDGVKLYLSVGHDEYWSREMRDRVEAYIDSGGNAAFFSGNTAFWHTRREQDRWVCYKMTPQADPHDGTANVATMWSDPLLNRPENSLTGVSFTRGGYAHMPNSPQGSGGYHIWRPEHWVFDGVQLAAGADLGADALVVGYECDGCDFTLHDGRPAPTGADGTPADMEILATAPARLWRTEELPDNLRDDYVGELNWVAERLAGEDNEANRAIYADGHAVMATFKKGAGAVFTTGCTDWAYGLDDANVSRVTRNIIERFAGVRLR